MSERKRSRLEVASWIGGIAGAVIALAALMVDIRSKSDEAASQKEVPEKSHALSETCEPVTDAKPATDVGTYEVHDPYVLQHVGNSNTLIYTHREPDGTLNVMMQYATPATPDIDYNSLQTGSFRECLDKCLDEAICGAAEYFEATRSCHLLQGPFQACVFPSKKPSYFAIKMHRMKP